MSDTQSTKRQQSPAGDDTAGSKHDLDEKSAPDTKKQKTIEETLGG